MTSLPLFTPPEPCTHKDDPSYLAGRETCDRCEQRRTDESIRRADAALKRMERREQA